MKGLFENKKRRVEDSVNEALRKELTPAEEDALFERAAFDPGAGEKTGYSNYSYWRSTFRAFLHNKTAVVMLVLLVVLVAFTFIQPLLPGQYEANTVNNNPLTGIQLQNQAPSTSTVYMTVPEGTQLIGQKLNDEWYAVSNVSSTIKKRQKFTVTGYGEEWCEIQYGDQTGFVKNNFQTSLKLPYLAPAAGTVVVYAVLAITVTVLAGCAASLHTASKLSRVDPGSTLREGA